MYVIIGRCNECGSLVYSESPWHHESPPPAHYPCGCVEPGDLNAWKAQPSSSKEEKRRE